MRAMQPSPLSEAFAAAMLDTAAGHAPPLEESLREYVTVARKAWPELAVDDIEFVRYVAARAAEARLPPLAHAADLLLAYGCSEGLAPAVGAFVREYGPVMDRVLAHRKATVDVAADARQIVQQRLLVGDSEAGAPPKISAFRGVGPLKSWVASTAATTLQMLRRASSRRREQPEESGGEPLELNLDPELEYLRERYKTEVEAAIVHALGLLGDRERTLLRLHLTERLSIDVLGSMYAVNRATAARWLAAARRSLMLGARERLRSELRLSESECDSLVALVNSRLDVSIARRLSETVNGPTRN